jgi:hypothetical protein
MTPADLVTFESDNSDEESDGSEADDELEESPPVASMSSAQLPAVPPRKCRKLEIPAREMKKMAKEKRRKEYEKALKDIQKYI